MRIIIAKCSAIYTGRGDTKLNAAVRAIIIKSDGAVSIHNDLGNKPLNYMGKGNIFTESIDDGLLTWSFETRKENLTLTLEEVFSDSDHILVVEDEGLIRDGTENQLQLWLSENPHALGEGYTVVQREFNTGSGPVDLLAQDASGNYVAVEVKRTAMLNSVSQVKRYVDALQEMPGFEGARGMIAALDIRPNTLKLAEKRGIDCVSVENAWSTRRQIDGFEE